MQIFKKKLSVFFVYFFLTLTLFLSNYLPAGENIRFFLEKYTFFAKEIFYKTKVALWQPVTVLLFWQKGTKKILDLERRNRELEATVNQVTNLQKENEALRIMCSIEHETKYTKKLAGVVSKVSDKMIINKGKNSGIENDSVVIFEDVLLGKIVSVNPLSSVVDLLFSGKQVVNVATQRGSRGTLQGVGNKLYLKKVFPTETILPGDVVLTSVNSDFPKGLIIGRIGQIVSDKRDVYQQAIVEQEIDYNNLDYVFVIQ